jgi:hypothetical protein
VRLLDEHGVRRYPFGAAGTLDLACGPRASARERPSVNIRSNVPITVEVVWEGGTDILNVEPVSQMSDSPGRTPGG